MTLREILARELRELARINASSRPWEMALGAAASGLQDAATVLQVGLVSLGCVPMW